ncbi:MAG: ATPase [Bacillota bacterium]|nr:ATPase [Bacillota bacterium]
MNEHDGGQSALAIVEELYAAIEAAKRLPLIGRAMIDQDEILDLLERLRDALPDEIAQARWVIRDRDRVVAQAKAEAERVLREASLKVDEMARESAIVEAARRHADQLVAQARQVALEIRGGANEYTDGLLLKVQDALKQGLRLIEGARTELRGQTSAAKASERASTASGGVRGSREAAPARDDERSVPE